MGKKSPVIRLRAFVEERRLNGRMLGELIGCTQGWAWMILAGRAQPHLDMATAIQRITKGWEGGQILAVEWASKEARAS